MITFRFLFSSAVLFATVLQVEAGVAAADDPLDQYNVVWEQPSRDSSGSMPIGNGDIGVNAWVEQNGDLLLLISKTDAWSGIARLVKLGRVRVKLSPNPLVDGARFRQTLKLRQGEIQIVAGPAPDLVTAEHRRQNLDWFDLSFGRGTAKQSDFPEVLLHQFDWDAWKETQSPKDLTNPFKNSTATGAADRVKRIQWMLGQVPANIEGAGQYHIRSEAELGVPSSSRDRWACPNTARMPVSFSGNIHGNVYYNPTIQRPVPAVIWLHPYSYGSGSNEGYGVQGTTVYHRLAQQGYVVLAYDQCGFGDRLLDGPGLLQEISELVTLGSHDP